MTIHPAPPTKRAQSTTSGALAINSAGRTGRRGLTVVAALFAAVSLTAAPITAHARNNGAGIALGVIGGVVAGAAIASTANAYGGYGYGGYGGGYGYSGYPTYTAPAQNYYAPQSSYYPQSTYYSATPYYGNYGSSYAPYNYGNSYYYGGR